MLNLLRLFNCAHCGLQVASRHRDQKYCCRSCCQKAYRQRQKTKPKSSFPYFQNTLQNQLLIERYGALTKDIHDYWT